MTNYRVDVAQSKLVVQARSSIHDSTTVWDKVSGTAKADPTDLMKDTSATFAVDMTSFDAGDWLKNRKLKKDFALDKHPQAEFTLSGLRDVEEQDDGSFTATATGTLSWRGKQVELTIKGSGTVSDASFDVKGSFELDVRDLGMKAPRVLMFKIEDVVTCDVTLRATAG